MADFIVDEEISENESSELEFYREGHVKYLKSVLKVLPTPYEAIDTSRLTALYFAVAGLDILGELDSLDKTAIVDFLYNLQIYSLSDESKLSRGGFIGGNFMNHTMCNLCTSDRDECTNLKVDNMPSNSVLQGSCDSCPLIHMHNEYHQGHIAMTYTAMVSLVTLGDDLTRINQTSVLSGMKTYIIFYVARQQYLNSFDLLVFNRIERVANAERCIPRDTQRERRVRCPLPLLCLCNFKCTE